MGICNECHRDSTCLHKNPISIKEMYFLIAYVMFVSQIGYALFFEELSSDAIGRISLIGSIEMIIILIPLVVMYMLFDKQYLALFFGCHQKKERSVNFGGRYFILCARCSGILLGVILSPIVFLFEINELWIFLLMVLLLVDGFVQRFSKYESNNFIRLFTGILFAPGFVILFSLLNYYIHYGFTFVASWIIELF